MLAEALCVTGDITPQEAKTGKDILVWASLSGGGVIKFGVLQLRAEKDEGEPYKSLIQ